MRALIIAPPGQGKTSLALSLLSRNEHPVFYYTNDENVRLRGRATLFPGRTLAEHLKPGIGGSVNLVVDNVHLSRMEMEGLMSHIYKVAWWSCYCIITVNTVKQIPPAWIPLFITVYVGHVADVRERKALALHFGGGIDSRPKEFTVITTPSSTSLRQVSAQRVPWITRPDFINYHRVIRFSPLWCKMPKDLKVYLGQFIVEWDF